jgi:hypothetical protein
MADIYSVAQTYNNAGVAITASNTGANAKRAVVYYPGTAVAGASPFSQFGTRELVLLKATAGSGTPFAASTLDDADSDYFEAINTIADFGEIYFVQRVSDTVIAFMIANDTRNGSETATPNTQAATYGRLETALGAAVTGGLTFTVAAATLS